MRYEEYPKGDDGEALDTPVWRNADNIKDTASSKDSVLIKAIREWDTDPAQLTAALAAGEDINGLDRVRCAASHRSRALGGAAHRAGSR